MTERVRRAAAAGLMVLAVLFGIVATSEGATAQQAGQIQTYRGPVNNSGVQAYGVSGSPFQPVLVPASTDPFFFNGFYGGYNYNTFGYGFSPYGYGFNNFGYGVPYYGGTTLSANYGAGCVPQVSFTPAFGYGFGCQQFGTPFSNPFVGYYR